MMINRVITALSLIVLCGCATPYAPEGPTGGYSETELEPGIWRVQFLGNIRVNRETVQTYWLYRAAELTLQKGFDGFEIISPIQLASKAAESSDQTARAIPAAAVFNPVPLPSYDANPLPIPVIIADIRLLKKPFDVAPAKIFDAGALKAELDPHVKGKLCDGNVCPHVHHYLMPASST